jgi:hypothetical protein
MKTVTLPTGAEATFRDPSEILGRGKKIILGATMASIGVLTQVPALQEGRRGDETPEQFIDRLGKEVAQAALNAENYEAIQSLKEAAVVAQLASWTLPLPLPTMETIGDLPVALYDALVEAVGEITPQTLGQGFEENSNPDSPTNDSEC